ncbi:WD40 repeat domain-containing protein [Streptomyces sp. RB110-1]|uniref:WD40 repeat domain-containing protein n=1 Tax=unclassified Streptomyces TaxID=2593676 RepID=UPI0018FF81DB|nr:MULTISPECIES: WD40 repeat domain-containing protein [unclassified Streptomyces]MBK0372630.1 WD40 repeat domain-containing protein [Streptomyces sp. RB110-1]MBK0384620.1 WD40 repeat domain-containing protein [Streptomyces sp. RB110-2]
MFLAWLVEHATEPDTEAVRRVHALVPLAGHSVRTVAWQLAEQLQVSARTPGELLTVLARDPRRTVIALPDLHESTEPARIEELACALATFAHVRVILETRAPSAALLAAGPAVMDLAAPQWTDADRYAAWAATEQPAGHEAAIHPGRQAPADLDDPASVCGADPLAITTAYESATGSHGGLRTAWLRSGASVSQPQDPASRALVLWSALGDDADPRMENELGGLARQAKWRVRWRRVRGDVTPPWPGPARSLSPCRGEAAGTVAVLDHQGVVRLVSDSDGRPKGRLPRPAPGAVAVAAAGEDLMAVLDRHGRLTLQKPPAAPRPSGIAGLLEGGPSPWESLTEQAARHTSGPALACTSTSLAVGSTKGTVHVLTANDAATHGVSTTLHKGSVTALALVEPAEGCLLVYSGGQDGRVRLWDPDRDPLNTPITERACEVTALAAAPLDGGVALATGWADGLVEYSVTGADADGRVRHFRPGPPVRALCVLPGGDVLIGTDESLIRLEPT